MVTAAAAALVVAMNCRRVPVFGFMVPPGGASVLAPRIIDRHRPGRSRPL
jgi:hypothetical protein